MAITRTLLLVLAAATPAAASDPPLRISMGARDPVCIEAEQILGKIPVASFASQEDWRKWFDPGTGWKPVTTSVLRANGTTVPFSFTYAPFDIDNDREQEIILWNVAKMSSVAMDVWYIFDQQQFQSALGHNVPVALLMSVPALKGYANSAEGYVPTDFAPWRRNGVNYIVMREFGFPKKRNISASFLVTKYDGFNVHRRGDGPTATVRVICDIR
jgi:hypothetical protein